MRVHQLHVARWMLDCFGADISADKVERNDRFIEEALELVQSTGFTAERAHALVDYVFSRPAGEPGQEVGGVMVTLAALCNVHNLSISEEAGREVTRITTPEMVSKIRAKQAAKPTGSALPVAIATNVGTAPRAFPGLVDVVLPRDPAGRRPDPVSFVLGLAAQPWKISGIAMLLREAGVAQVPRKAEAEMSAALHWLLELALHHGDRWASVYEVEVAKLSEVARQAHEERE